MARTDAAPVLATARLVIDALRASDAERLLSYRARPEVARYQAWAPRTPEDAARFIASATEAFGRVGTWYQLALRRREDGVLVGDVGLHFLDEAQVELGITLEPGSQRQGLAREALAAVLDHLFVVLGKHRVVASADPRNGPSRRLLEALGFRQEAHFRESLFLNGEWVDDVVYAVLRSEWAGPAR